MKDIRIAVRVTAKEKDKIQSKARKGGLSTTEYVKDIFRRLRDHGYDENTMTLYVTGGGGCLVKNFSKVNADRVKFIDDICAAAKGYEYLAEAQIKAEAKL